MRTTGCRIRRAARLLGILVAVWPRGNLISGLSAQASSSSTLARDSVLRRWRDLTSLIKGGSVQPRWMADGQSFWYVDSTPDRTVALRVDLRQNVVAPLLDVARVRRTMATALGHEPPYSGLPFTTFSFVEGERAIRFALESRDWILDRETYQVRVVPGLTASERARNEPQLVRR